MECGGRAIFLGGVAVLTTIPFFGVAGSVVVDVGRPRCKADVDGVLRWPRKGYAMQTSCTAKSAMMAFTGGRTI
ncbi:MFS transporter protein [Sesbania bispinosa]|nr:MFS transporter protein [Sesbania bispinosa]